MQTEPAECPGQLAEYLGHWELPGHPASCCQILRACRLRPKPLCVAGRAGGTMRPSLWTTPRRRGPRTAEGRCGLPLGVHRARLCSELCGLWDQMASFVCLKT